MRTVGVKLEAETAGYKREMAEAAKVTAEADRAAGQLGKTSESTGRKVDDLGDDFRDTGRDAQRLKDEIKSLERSLTGLAAEFAATSKAADRIDLTKQIRKQHGELRQLLKVQKLLPSDAEIKPATQSVARKLMIGLAEGAATNAARSPLVTALVAAGTAAAPVLIPALSAAVSAGVGAGLLGVGVALAAKDPLIAERGKEIGADFVAGLQSQASHAFQGPILDSLTKLELLGVRTTQRLGKAFDSLAPSIGPLVNDLVTAGDRLGTSLAGAAATSGPAMRALGDSVVLISNGVGDFIDTLSSGGPDAAANLRLIAGATGDLLTQTANFLNVVDKLSNNPWITGPLLPILRKHYAETADAQKGLGNGTTWVSNGIKSVGDAAAKANPPARVLLSTMNDSTKAAVGQRDALSRLSTALRAQADPAFALILAERDLKTAQDNAAAATKKHGRNSAEARTATRALTLAAIDLQGKVGALGNTFDGKLSPSMRTTLHAAGLTKTQINDVAKQFREAKRDGDRFAKKYGAEVRITGADAVKRQLAQLQVMQLALRKGVSMSAARALAGDAAAAKDRGLFHAGGYTGPGPKYQEAGVVHADEYVIRKESRQKIERRNPGLLDEMNATGQLPGYASGGQVGWPFPATASMTRIPSKAEAMAAVTPAVPTGGRTDQWIIQAARSLVGAIRVISAFRPGAHTLSGNLSYHALGRAVDFAPSITLARRWHDTYGPRTKEEISPWRQYDVRNGRPHFYSSAIHNQHSGGNAHVHIAMRGGGVIDEPIVGVGASGRTYSFGENYQREHVVPERAIAAGAGGGGTSRTLTLAPVFHISGANQSPEQIAAAVDRRIGARIDYYARGV